MVYTVVEFKAIQIDFLNLTGTSLEVKAKTLTVMPLQDILQLRFRNSKFHSGTVQIWLEEQLQSYITGGTVQRGAEVKQLIACICGGYCRAPPYLVREMNQKGIWIGDWQLIEDMGSNKRK